ncbi:MAG: sel1 repeat family protein [Nitrospirae bacterium]|nr:sel1 repeat family protein [Nitrospirota bacterium]MCL5977182.1 sel1 repeat family protein [Nitrospirota bacterium]
MSIKLISIIAIGIIVFPCFVLADDFDEAVSAYEAGDYQKAYNLLLKEAEKNNPVAQYNLGFMNQAGKGVKGVRENYKEALKWYRLAAEQGHLDAQINLGYMYHNGMGMLKDYKEAIKWYKLAAEKGNALAKCNLAEMYAAGWGTKKDFSIAKKLAKEGYDAGDDYCRVVWDKYDLANY